MSNKLWRNLRDRLSAPLTAVAGLFEDDDKEAPPQRREGGERRRDEPSYAELDISLHLEQLLHEEGGRFNSKLYVISLAEFREAVGDKWLRLSEKVMLIAETTIQRHIGHANVFGRQGEDMFVLAFSELREAEARIRSATIATELGTRLLGSSRFSGSIPLVQVAEMDVEEVKGGDGKLNLQAMQQAISTVRTERAEEDAKLRALHLSEAERKVFMLRRHLQPSDWVMLQDTGLRRHLLPSDWLPEFEGGLRAHLRPDGQQPVGPTDYSEHWRQLGQTLLPEGEDRIRQVLASGGPGADPAALIAAESDEPPARHSGGPPSSELREQRRPFLQNVEVPTLDPSPREDCAVDEVPEAVLGILGAAWTPTWVASEEALAAFVLHLSRNTSTTGEPAAGARAYANEGPRLIRALDTHAVAETAKAMAALAERKLKATLILPLHFATLSGAHHRTVTDLVAELPENLRLARLVVEVFGIPDSVDTAGLSDAVRRVRPFCREVAVRVGWSDSRVALAASSGATLAGADISDMTAQAQSEARFLPAIKAFQTSCQRHWVLAYTWGLRGRVPLVRAVNEGYAMVNGPGLIKDVSKPDRVVPAPKKCFAG